MRYGYRAKVRIKPTYTTSLSADVDEIMVTAQSEDKLERDLLAVRISNSITAPYQTFRIDLAPRERWAQVIQPYSLVEISLQRYSGDASDPASTDTPVPVFVGLVDYVEFTEDFGQASPNRRISIAGRSLSAILSDHRWWHHWFLADAKGKPGSNPDFSDIYASNLNEAQRQREAEIGSLGLFAVDPNLFDSAVLSHPSRAMQVAFDFFVGRPDAPGFIKLEFTSNGKKESLGRRLKFDEAATLAGFHDPNCRLSRQVIPTSDLPSASCWDVLAHFCEPPFTELFTDTFEDERGQPFIQVVARKPPWAGFIAYDGSKSVVGFNHSRPTGRSSLFDTTFGPWDAFLDTVTIDGSDVICRSLRRGLDGQEATYNAFAVLPQTSSAAGNSIGDTLMQREVPPYIDEDPDSPSYVLRYGIRPAPKHLTKYLSVIGADDSKLDTGNQVRRAMAYELLMREWYYRQPEFWHGTYVLKGRTSLRVGKRLVDRAVGREYYITAVVHDMRLDRPQPYTTTISVARGWDINLGE